MAAVSQNGWPAALASSVSRRQVPGSQVALTVRFGAAGDLLLEVAACFDELVQDIDTARGATPDDWGFAARPVRGSDTEISNHASGTAIDLNATRWPLGSDPSVNLTPLQIATVRAICGATGGVVRWGGDYRGRTDPMHFEVNDGQTEASCARALDALQDWHHMQQEDHVALGQDDIDRIAAATTTRLLGTLIADLYPAAPKGHQLTVGDTLAWACAHAAVARDQTKPKGA